MERTLAVISITSRSFRCFICCLLGLAASVVPAPAGKRKLQKEKRRTSVRDAIEMTSWADHEYFLGREPDGRVGLFSADGKQFVVVVKKGNVERNTNEYSVLLFQTNAVFSSAKPDVLFTMSSSSNRDAVSHVKWLSDTKTIVFLGENPGQLPAVYSFNIETRQLTRLTKHASPIVAYDISTDGQEIIYEADANTEVDKDQIRRTGLVITTQDPSELLNCGCDPEQKYERPNKELFLERAGQQASRISTEDLVTEFLPLSLSPSGRYAVISVYVKNIPPSWLRYQDPILGPYLMERPRPGAWSNVRRYMLLDTSTRIMSPLIDTPVAWSNHEFLWAKDGNSLILSGTYLPLDVAATSEEQIREKQTFVVEVRLPGKEIVKITDSNLKVVKWNQANRKVILQSGSWSKKTSVDAYESTGTIWKQVPLTDEDLRPDTPLDVTLEEDINTPPRVFALEPKTRRRIVVLDLNPQFSEIQFGKVEAVTWSASDGHIVSGGLYLPPDYSPGNRYPLVIQTHGFKSDRFWIDGPWSSAFAAQPLAANDIVVLQVGGSIDPIEDMKYSNTPQEAPRQMAAYEGAIDYLQRRGLIDRARVGIIGFSRTVFYAEYTLTHSKYSFAAASLADGFDGGYVNYVLWPDVSYTFVNGGLPFGSSLSSWLKNSPGFNLDRVQTAIHLEYYGPQMFLGGWQWFSGLSLLEKAVDYVWLPTGTHLLVKPWDRIASQQRNVDWFRFWLTGDEDPDPAKKQQYKGWEELRRLHTKDSEASSSGS
jgi:dipeptidyl aminopeptidase/acylaminoacyl peptidase